MIEEKKKRIDKRIFFNWVKVVSFILIFLLALDILSQTVFSKSAATTYMNKHKNAYSYSNEIEDSVQIIALGNSDLYSALLPVKMWDEQGYTSTVIAAPRQSAMESYSVLNDALKNQKPSIILVETDMLYYGVSVMADEPEEDTKKRQLPLIPYLTNEQITEDIRNRYSIFILHDRWKQLIDFRDEEQKKDDTICEHGFFFSKKIHKTSKNDYMNVTDRVEPIPSEGVYYLNKIKETCDDIGAQMLLVELPSIASWSYPRHNAVAAYAEEAGVNFIDFNLLMPDINLNLERDFRDNGNHLNYYGARKVTLYLGDYIKENYNLIDNRSNDDYAYWYDHKEQFIKKYSIKVF